MAQLESPKKKFKWASIVPQAIVEAQAYYDEYKIAGTLRAIYYRLVGLEAFPNTVSSYKALSRTLSKARVNGTFPWELMQDKTRKSSGQGKEVSLETAKEWASTEVRDHLQAIEKAFNDIQNPEVNFRPSVWDGQPCRVIVAIEKEAVMGAVQNVLKGLDVEIFPLKGYASTTFMRVLAKSVKRLNDYGETHLIIITDYDPSGEDMVRDINQRLLEDYFAVTHSEKVLLTRPQIVEYSLPPAPAKKKDARYEAFVNKTGSTDVVELDALSAINPQAFRKIIREAVTKYFDEDIRDERKDEAKEACDEAEEELLNLYEQLEEVHEEVRTRIKAIKARLQEEEA